MSLLTKDETPFQKDIPGVRFSHYGETKPIAAKVAEVNRASRSAGYQPAQPGTCVLKPLRRERYDDRFHHFLLRDGHDSWTGGADSQAGSQVDRNPSNVGCSRFDTGASTDARPTREQNGRSTEADGKWRIKTIFAGCVKTHLRIPCLFLCLCGSTCRSMASINVRRPKSTSCKRSSIQTMHTEVWTLMCK